MLGVVVVACISVHQRYTGGAGMAVKRTQLPLCALARTLFYVPYSISRACHPVEMTGERLRKGQVPRIRAGLQVTPLFNLPVLDVSGGSHRRHRYLYIYL